MKFNYQARTKSGEIQTGEIEASSREKAISLLQKYNLYVTFLEQAKDQPFYFKKIKILLLFFFFGIFFSFTGKFDTLF